MNRVCLSIIFLTVFLNSQAQKHTQFSGIVLDNETGRAVQWVHVLSKKHNTGTISNEEGRFNFQINEPVAAIVIEVSCIGYKSIQLSIDSSRISPARILLHPESKLLKEVVITSKSAREIVQSAINRIPNNYASSPYTLTGFYRESLRRDTSDFFYIAEGVIKARKEGYGKNRSKGMVKLVQARRKDFYDSIDRMKFYAGPHVVHRFDFVMNRPEFIATKEIDEYEYTLDDVTRFEGDEVYKINFRPKTTKGLFQGSVYVNSRTGAFTSARYRLTNAGLTFYETNLLSQRGFRWLKREYVVNYYESRDNEWAIQNVWQEGVGFDLIRKDTLVYTTEFATTSIDEKDVDPFLYEERLLFRDIFSDEVIDFDPEFWNRYTIIQESSFVQRLQNKKLNTVSLKTSYVPTKISEEPLKIVRTQSRMSADVGLTFLFPAYESFYCDVSGPGFTLSQSVEPPSKISLGLTSSFNVRFSKHVVSAISLTSALGRVKYDNVAMNVGYSFNSSVRTRPFSLTPSVGLSYTKNYIEIGTIDPSAPLEIDGNELSGKLGVSLLDEFYSFQPAVKASIELNRMFDLYFSAFYTLRMNSNKSISIKEKDGFFLSRGKGTLSTDSDEIDLQINSASTDELPVFMHNLTLSAGIVLKYPRK